MVQSGYLPLKPTDYIPSDSGRPCPPGFVKSAKGCKRAPLSNLDSANVVIPKARGCQEAQKYCKPSYNSVTYTLPNGKTTVCSCNQKNAPSATECPAGQRYSNIKKQCVTGAPSAQSAQTCPAGQRYSNIKKQCVSIG